MYVSVWMNFFWLIHNSNKFLEKNYAKASQSFRYYPSNLRVLDWLGTYFIEHQVAEKALGYFERAALMQPNEVKWQLMAASCYRRSGNYHQALRSYKDIHARFPENVECLKFLIRLCSDLGLKEATEYALELKKAEKAKEVRERIGSSRPGSLRSGSGRSSRGGLNSPLSESPLLSAGTRNSPPVPQQVSRLHKMALLESSESYSPTSQHREIDASYSDPLGPLAERPRTSVGRKPQIHIEDEFGDEELGEDLLPV